ncbi:MAG: hypothetical protein M0026_10675 [Nocardiopsaceae bacterium]|nr:hypothetical protein [Nocardiopsaceae bacterium]
MVDTTLITTVLVITLAGIGVVFAGGIAYVVKEEIQRRRGTRDQAFPPAPADPLRAGPQQQKQPA